MRYNGVENWAPVFENVNAYKPSEFLYMPATTRGLLSGRSYNSSLRTTWQATPRNKIAGTYKQDTWCDCPNGISAVVAPEAARDFRFPLLRQIHGEWTSPVTSRMLLEVVGMHLYERWGFMHHASVYRLVSRVRDYRALDDLGHRAVDTGSSIGRRCSTTTTLACRTSPTGRRWRMSLERTASRRASTGCTASRRRPTTT